MAQPTAQTDRDLTSIHEARTLVRRAKAAAGPLGELSQDQIDAIVDAMAQAATAQAEPLARLAHEETGYGVAADKVQKNLFSSEKVYRFIRPMKTVGVVRRIEDRKVIEIAEPFGVVAAIVPSTNPTSTAIYKILISIKARCPIVISPHPAAVRCISRVAEIMSEAARRAGAPDGAISWMTTVTLEGTQELMRRGKRPSSSRPAAWASCGRRTAPANLRTALVRETRRHSSSEPPTSRRPSAT